VTPTNGHCLCGKICITEEVAGWTAAIAAVLSGLEVEPCANAIKLLIVISTLCMSLVIPLISGEMFRTPYRFSKTSTSLTV
jgi:hypothetical protein